MESTNFAHRYARSLSGTGSDSFTKTLVFLSFLAMFCTIGNWANAADSISINFAESGSNTMDAGSTFGALGIDGQYWNITTAASGTLDLTGVRWQIGSQAQLGTSAVTVNVNPTGQVFATSGTISGTFNIAGGGRLEGAGCLGALRIDGSTLAGTVNVLAAGASVCTYSSDGTLSANLNGAGQLKKTGSKALTFSGSYANFTGKLYVSQGTLNFQSSNNSDADYNNIYIDGGTFAFNTARNRMTFQSQFTNNGGTLNWGAQSLNNRLCTGSAASFIKVGDNGSASSNVTGCLNLNGGTLNLSACENSTLNVSGNLDNYGTALVRRNGQSREHLEFRGASIDAGNRERRDRNLPGERSHDAGRLGAVV